MHHGWGHVVWWGAGSAILGILLGMNDRHGRFQILQRQFELVRIALLRPPPEGRLLEGRDQLLNAFDPLDLAPVARFRGDQHRLQRSNFFKQISGIRHGRSLPNRHWLRLWKAPAESSCRSLHRSLHGFGSLRLDGPNPPPIQPGKQRLELCVVHQH